MVGRGVRVRGKQGDLEMGESEWRKERMQGKDGRGEGTGVRAEG